MTPPKTLLVLCSASSPLFSSELSERDIEIPSFVQPLISYELSKPPAPVSERVVKTDLRTSFPSLLANDVIGVLPSLPDGFGSHDLANSSVLRGDSLLSGGLDFSLSLNGDYYSNVTQTSGSEISDFSLGPNLRASYLVGDSTWNLGVNANLGHREYFERSDFSDTYYSLGIFGGYNSRKTVLAYSANVLSGSGVDLQTSEFLDQLTFSSNLMMRYRLSGKTSLLATWEHSNTSNDIFGFNDTSSWTLGLSALWRATGKMNLGPGIRYGVRSVDSGADLTVIGPTLRVNYDLLNKVSLRSSIGLDIIDSPFTDSRTRFNWSLGVGYRASSLWGLDFNLVRDSEASFTRGTGYDETTALQLSYWRKIRRAKLTLSAAYQMRSSLDRNLASGLEDRDSDYFTLSARYSRPIFRERATIDFDFSYMNFESDNVFSDSWNGIQLGCGIHYSF